MNDATVPIRKRGRPRLLRPDAVEPVREAARPNTDLSFGRSRKRKGNIDQFYVDPAIIPYGWTYEWKRKSIYNMPDTSHQIGLMENGWTPVPADRHPGTFMPPGYVGEVTRGENMLMERPTQLCDEARIEDRANANYMLDAQRQQLGLQMPTAFNTNHPGVRPQIKTSYERGPPQARQPIAID